MKLLRLLRKFTSIHHEPPYEWIMDGDMNGKDVFDSSKPSSTMTRPSNSLGIGHSKRERTKRCLPDRMTSVPARVTVKCKSE